jgi:hypothetical protein
MVTGGVSVPVKKRASFLADFRQRHSLRFHMSVILLATALSGVLASKLFLACRIDNFTLRYPLAVLLAYGVFFLCIKLWLAYLSPRQSRVDCSDLLDLNPSGTGGSGSADLASFHGAGGEFSGAGASASFESPLGVVGESPLASVSEGASGALEGVGDVVGGVADALGDEAGLVGVVVLALLTALVAVILGGAVYVISEAPVILSEAAFDGFLAVSLVKKVRIIDGEGWLGGVFRTTWKPFAVTLAASFLAALMLHAYFPAATRLSDILK